MTAETAGAAESAGPTGTTAAARATTRLARAVRHQLGLGRLLPLGEAEDGAWVTEAAAATALGGAAARAVPGVRLSGVRLDLSDAETAGPAAVPPPPSALPPGPLTLTADLAVPADRPVPAVADDLRHALLAAAEREWGLPLRTVDLRVTELLDEPYPPAAAASGANGHDTSSGARAAAAPSGAPRAFVGSGGLAEEVAAAVLAVDGVDRLTPVLGPPLALSSGGPRPRAVTVTPADSGGAAETEAGTEAEADAAPGRNAQEAGSGHGGRHVLIQFALAPGHRAIGVARAVRTAAHLALAQGGDGPATVAVLITGVGPA
ncbi:nucleopolyhedrovirus P10 family protein [Streptomyces axinellae]|uniref:Nucleopolyhedrovirus P10 family protein n=1 Tax=Streptomyces axinellae TaxID=552788 RepID=A0ABP6D3A5_9ACTN